MGGLSVIFLMSILSFIFLLYISLLVITIIYVIISYIFESMTITTINNNLNHKHPYTAWIPFYNKYLLGTIAGNKVLGHLTAILNFINMSLTAYFYIYQKLTLIPFCVLLVSLILSFIFNTIISYKIYKSTTNKYGDILTVLTVLSLGFLRPIILFLIKDKITVKE